MKKEDISEEQYNKILDCFISALKKNGLKATTMDSIASSLQMSKRTLYEIFGTKDDMFRDAHVYFHKKMKENLTKIFNDSSNVMEAIIRCFLFNRDVMSSLSPEFMRDIEEFASHENILTPTTRRKHYQNLYDVLQSGVEQGYFREDVNLAIQCRMLIIQMEALKRTEELFPEDISLLEVYDTIIIGFLRGISSAKGLQELETFKDSFFTSPSHRNEI